MQLMPATARYVAQDGELPGGTESRLFNPGFNLELAQRYVQRLMQDDEAGEDLFKLAAAYNGGPGNLRKWQRRLEKAGYPAHDPLLFIEALPSHETRLFIERVLTNLWMYRKRLGQPAPSLKALAQGDWPRYEALD
jgi:soluble lytic murein transglycosylase-like protein